MAKKTFLRELKKSFGRTLGVIGGIGFCAVIAAGGIAFWQGVAFSTALTFVGMFVGLVLVVMLFMAISDGGWW